MFRKLWWKVEVGGVVTCGNWVGWRWRGSAAKDKRGGPAGIGRNCIHCPDLPVGLAGSEWPVAKWREEFEVKMAGRKCGRMYDGYGC